MLCTLISIKTQSRPKLRNHGNDAKNGERDEISIPYMRGLRIDKFLKASHLLVCACVRMHVALRTRNNEHGMQTASKNDGINI